MKKYLITGLIILMPVALTLLIIIFLIDFFTEPFVPLVAQLVSLFEERFHFILPTGFSMFVSQILALILLFFFILLLGALARWFVMRNVFQWAHRLITHIPFIKTVYKVSKDIFSALFSADGKKAFKRPVIIPFPFPPHYTVGFQAGEVAEECQEKVDTPLVSVFFPTAPHPISGFLLLVPEKDVHEIDMNNEEAVKFLVSCGIIYPDMEKTNADEVL